MSRVSDLKITMVGDGAELAGIKAMDAKTWNQGLHHRPHAGGQRPALPTTRPSRRSCCARCRTGQALTTATNDILSKLSLLGKDHVDYWFETVEMFYKDASAAGYTISCATRAVSA
jgi:hypothetical protein